jgi:glycosyltransferase involved in cell wall biosynthesis
MGIKLTIGMPSYSNFTEVFFTVQALRMYHDLTDCEILIVDNFGDPELEKFWKANGKDVVRYEKYLDTNGPAGAKNAVFELARGEMVLCIDSHVLLIPGSLKNIPVTDDLIHGPLLYNDMKNYVCDFKPQWRGHMWGVWGDYCTYDKLPKEPFEIWGDGMGCFLAKKDTWLGFPSRYRGFGAEEGVIHEMYRKAGRKVKCLPSLIWAHLFDKKIPYPLKLVDRVHNYLVGFSEIGMDPKPIEDHFGAKLVAEARAMIAQEDQASRILSNMKDKILP